MNIELIFNRCNFQVQSGTEESVILKLDDKEPVVLEVGEAKALAEVITIVARNSY